MTSNIHSASSYIYDAVNIPAFESHLFGLSKRMISWRFLTDLRIPSATKSRIECWNTQRGKCKMTERKSTILPCNYNTKRVRLQQRQENRKDIIMKNIPAFEKNYLTVADVKSYLCISSTAAYELCHRKDFPVTRLGSSIRIPTDLFLAWVEKHTHIPADLAGNRQEVTFRVG